MRRTVNGANGVELAVWERGPKEAPTVLFVHGYPDSHTVWDLVGDQLERDHHIVAFDVRGAGESDKPKNARDYAVEHLVADIAAVIEAVSPDRPVHLVAHDWGSIQAWSVVLDLHLRDRIASFTSMSGPGLAIIDRWMADRLRPGGGRWQALSHQAVRSWYIMAFQNPLAPLAWRSGLARAWPWFLSNREGVPTDDRWPGEHVADDASNGVKLYQANLSPGAGLRRSRSVENVLPTTVPVQLIIATEDSYVTPALLDDAALLAPNLTTVRIVGGHWLPRSNPIEVAELVRTFVGGTDVITLP